MEQAKQAVEAAVEGVKNVSLGKDAKKENKKGAPKPKKAAAPAAGAAGSITEMNPPPAFIEERLAMFDRLKKEVDEENAKKPRDAIMITMPDKSVKPGTAWETTPRSIAEGISKSLYKRTVIAKVTVEGEEPTLWDLERPLEKSCKLELLSFDTAEGKQVFWHSSAHALGEASERCYGCLLSRGPPTEDGFYYDMALPEAGAVQASDWSGIEALVGKIAKEKQKFERLEMSKEDLLKMFAQNEFKQHYIQHNVPDGTRSTVYRNGPFIDFCRGPHIPDTGRIEAFSIVRNSATYFLGDAKNTSLQRIAGISFPDKKLMQEHKRMMEEAMKRDHRKIGRDQDLFFFHPFSPGSAFWKPHGHRVYDAIVDYLKREYRRRGYDLVKTPNVYLQGLFETSGHWQHYREDMFHWHQEEDEPQPGEDGKPKVPVEFGLKPMNCPGHALLFREDNRSYHDLPIRYAEFGVLHRNEASGALSGLTRVRRFEQDDAHIFCTEEQIGAEFSNLFDMLQKLYGILGLTFRLKLSTRNPEKFMGSIETWDRAESMLKDSLNEFSKKCGIEWELNEGDGAFYGPKIDVAVLDCLKRSWQCATLQLDFMQPENFSLEYKTGESSEQVAAEAQEKAEKGSAPVIKADATGKMPKKALSPGCARPVMIHRAMAGSVERFVAILIEHFAGKWPFWLSPRHVLIVPVGVGFYDYGKEVREVLQEQELYVDIDVTGETLPKKVRRGQLAQYNFIFIVGAEEKQNRQVNIRYRDDTSSQSRGTPVALDEAATKLRALMADRGMYNPFAEDKPAEPAVKA